MPNTTGGGGYLPADRASVAAAPRSQRHRGRQGQIKQCRSPPDQPGASRILRAPDQDRRFHRLRRRFQKGESGVRCGRPEGAIGPRQALREFPNGLMIVKREKLLLLRLRCRLRLLPPPRSIPPERLRGGSSGVRRGLSMRNGGWDWLERSFLCRSSSTRVHFLFGCDVACHLPF